MSNILEDIEYEPIRSANTGNGTIIKLGITLSCKNTYTLDEVFYP